MRSAILNVRHPFDRCGVNGYGTKAGRVDPQPVGGF